MVGKITQWVKKRPRLTDFFGEIRGKNVSKGGWKPLSKLANLGTTASVKSILSGPEGSVRSQFVQRFRGQRKGFFGSMSLFEVGGLLSGVGERKKKRNEPKTIDRKGYSIIG